MNNTSFGYGDRLYMWRKIGRFLVIHDKSSWMIAVLIWVAQAVFLLFGAAVSMSMHNFGVSDVIRAIVFVATGFGLCATLCGKPIIVRRTLGSPGDQAKREILARWVDNYSESNMRVCHRLRAAGIYSDVCPWPNIKTALVRYFVASVGEKDLAEVVDKTFQQLWDAAEEQALPEYPGPGYPDRFRKSTNEVLGFMRALDKICEDDEDAADLVHASWLAARGDSRQQESYRCQVTDLARRVLNRELRARELERARVAADEASQNELEHPDMSRFVDEALASIDMRNPELVTELNSNDETDVSTGPRRKRLWHGWIDKIRRKDDRSA